MNEASSRSHAVFIVIVEKSAPHRLMPLDGLHWVILACVSCCQLS